MNYLWIYITLELYQINDVYSYVQRWRYWQYYFLQEVFKVLAKGTHNSLLFFTYISEKLVKVMLGSF